VITENEEAWLHRIRVCVSTGDFDRAEALLARALVEHPRSFELRRALAGIHQQTARLGSAETLLRELLVERPGDFASAFALSRLLLVQARSRAAAQILQECFRHGQHDAELTIKAIELLDEADRKTEAAAIVDLALVAAPADPRLHAYAGMLKLQLGQFDPARAHYLYALSHASKACEWHAPLGLASAQRYKDDSHPDFALFRNCLRQDLSQKARSTLLFALGKAHDDIGDYAQATEFFRQANLLARELTRWSRKDWRRAVEARLSAASVRACLQSCEDFVPVFIVGMPRSGTTLLAQMLAKFPRVCNRGEAPWIARLAKLPELSGAPTAAALQRAAAVYRMQMMQDDSGDARWFIDKQPLNFRYIDLILMMFPNAKIIHCQRNTRDTVVSLWMQSFTEDVQGYAYDFDDIAAVKQDESRLMAHWRKLFANSIHTLRYEELVANPVHIIGELGDWIGFESHAALGKEETSSISTASLWQARQPIYKHSLERWRNYERYLPELSRFPST